MNMIVLEGCCFVLIGQYMAEEEEEDVYKEPM